MVKPYARTRWTPDGLLEIVVDADTAQMLYGLVEKAAHPVALLVTALANTLAKPKEEGKP